MRRGVGARGREYRCSGAFGVESYGLPRHHLRGRGRVEKTGACRWRLGMQGHGAWTLVLLVSGLAEITSSRLLPGKPPGHFERGEEARR